jgi:hypothetical protein
MLSVDLLRHIRSERAQKKTKQPLSRALFDRINSLVMKYALGETFLERLGNFTDDPLRESVEFDRLKAKAHFEPPLFSLSTQEEYRVSMAIMEKVNNRYLHFVNSPDEILMCGPLFRRNPFLGPDQLARYHFETLLLYELAMGGLRDLKTPKVNRGGEK